MEESEPTPDSESVEGRHLRARIEERLFGRDEIVKVGRFVVLEQLGRGGMGVVYLAYDPELQRRVAVKVLSRLRPDARARTIREATTLARLNHPNVVTIHEVGEDAGEPFVAMEYIDGGTLRDWCVARPDPTPARTRAALELARQAIAGLAAAHVVGVVHRDVKPANMLIGSDGRLRLADFGLARSPSAAPDSGTTHDGSPHDRASGTSTDSIAGTPAYMAPEQFDGAADARSDQYSLCATLFEALHGVRPFEASSSSSRRDAVGKEHLVAPRTRSVPGYVRRVLQRGLSPRPEDRFPDLDALSGALQAGARRQRLRRLAAGGLGVALLVGGTALGVERYEAHERAERSAACEAEGASIDAVWNDGARQAVRQALSATDLRYAPTVADKVTPWLDEQAQAWRIGASEVCRHDSVHRDWDAARVDKAQWCLADRRTELASLVDALEGAGTEALPWAVQAAAGLSRVEVCLDERSLDGMPSPPGPKLRPQATEVREVLSRARTLESIGDYDEGLVEARAAREQAEALALATVTARAQAREASLLDRISDYDGAEAAGAAAYMQAARAGDWDVAAAAASTLVTVVGRRLGRHTDGRRWAEHAALALAYAGDPLGLREAARLANLGAVLREAGEYDEARASFEAALELDEAALGPDHPAVAALLTSLGDLHYTEGDLDGAKVLHGRALSIMTEVFGPEHPDVASVLSNLGAMAVGKGRFEDAKGHFERALEIQEATFGPEHPNVARLHDKLGTALASLHEYDAAKAELELALELLEAALGPDHDQVAYPLNNLGLVHDRMGDFESAETMHRRALEIREAKLGADHPLVATSLLNLGNAYAGRGVFDEAEPMYRRVVAIREAKLGVDHPDLAQPLSNLGRIYELTGDLDRAIANWRRSLEIREAALGPDHPVVAKSLSGLGNVLGASGDYAGATAMFERTLEIRVRALGADHPAVASALVNLANAHSANGEYPQARLRFERALAIEEKAVGPDDPHLAFALMGLGDVLLKLDDPGAAIEPLERALKLRESKPGIAVLLAYSRFTLARALWDAPEGGLRDRARARSLATQARATYAGMDPARDTHVTEELAEIDAWLRAHDR